MKNKKIGIIIGIILVIILIGGGVFAYLYINTDTFKTSKQLFSMYFVKNQELLEGFDIINTRSNIDKFLKDKEYTTKGELTFRSSNQTNSFSNLNVQIEGKTDELENQDYKKIKLMNNQEELLDIEYLKNDNIYALKSSQVVNLYLAIQNNNLKLLAKKLGVQNTEDIPDKIELIDNPRITEQPEINVINKYFNVLKDKVQDKNFTKQKNEDTEIYTLSLTQKEVGNIVKEVLQVLKEDDEVLNILLDSYDSNKTLDDLFELKNQIQSVINDINDMDLSDDVFLNIKLRVLDKQLTQTEIQVLLENGSIDINLIKNEQRYQATLNYKDNEGTKLNANILVSNNNEIDIKLGIDNVNANIQSKEMIKDEKSTSKNSIFRIEVDGDFIEIKYDEEKNITSNLMIDKLEENRNCVILNNYQQEALQDLIQQLQNRINQVYIEIGKKIGVISEVENQIQTENQQNQGNNNVEENNGENEVL